MTRRETFLGRLGAGIATARRSRLVSSAAGVGGLTVAELALGLVAAILLARALGAEGLGTYSLALAAVVLAGLPVEFGLPLLVMREIAHHDSEPEAGVVKGVLIFAVAVIALMSAVIIPLALIFGDSLAPGLEGAERAMLPVAIGLIPLSALGRVIGAALAGKQMVVIGMLPQRLVRPGCFAIALAAASVLDPGWLTPVRAMALQLTATAAALAVGGLYFVYHFADVLRPRRASISWRAWSGAMLRLGISNGIHLARGQILLLMTGILTGAENAGLLRIAQRGVGLVSIGNEIAVFTISPRVARLTAEGRHEHLQRLLTLTARAGTAFALIIFIGFVFGGHWLIETVFGTEFVAALNALIILAAAVTACTLLGPGAMVMNMLRREGITALGFVLSIVSSVSVGALLIPTLGEAGAAYGISVGYVCMSIFLWQMARRTVNLDPSAFGLHVRHGNASGV